MNPWPYQVQAVSREPRHTRSPLEANAILPLNEKGIIACIAPGAALDVSRSKADFVRPPLRTRGAVRQHRTQHTLDMSERHLDLTGIFPPQIPVEWVVLRHDCHSDTSMKRAAMATAKIGRPSVRGRGGQ